MLQFILLIAVGWPFIRLALATQFPGLLKRIEGARAQVQLESRWGPGRETRALRAVTNRLAAAAGTKAVTRVIEGDVVNAVALPHNRIYIWRGLVDLCGEDQEMLAGVIAHEIGHLSRDHFIERIGSLAMAQFALGVFVPNHFRGAIRRAMGEIVAGGFSRVQEEEADATAVRILKETGHDPEALARLFDRFTAAGMNGGGFMGSHPDSRARAARVRRLA